MLTIGKPITNFTFKVYHQDKEQELSFDVLKGKWLVVMFYPADFTFVCPTELQDMAAHYPEFQAEGAEVVSFSTDTVYVHKAWHDESAAIKTITFPMAADPTGAVTREFGVYIEDEGLARRGTFIIDPQGILKAYEVNDNSIGRAAAETLRKLRAAKFVAEHGGEVCPANWQPGAQTLKPGLDLVGKI